MAARQDMVLEKKQEETINDHPRSDGADVSEEAKIQYGVISATWRQWLLFLKISFITES